MSEPADERPDPKLHPLAERFASVAGAYERGRPEYPPAVAEALIGELGIVSGAPVLDLAAGTGKLSRALLAAGLDVIAVEPQESLRDALAEGIGAERVRDGFAEAIPLADGSVDAVTVADAFHWFDHAAALAETRRVLRPGGGLAVVTMIPDWSGASWAHELGALIQESRPEHPFFDGPPWQDTAARTGWWTEPREIHVAGPQPAGADRIVDYLASMSWIAAMSDPERAETLERVRGLVESGETPDELSVRVGIVLVTRT